MKFHYLFYHLNHPNLKTCSLLFIHFLFFSCENRSQNWTVVVENAGTYASAKAVDLNNDQILDIVVGAGGRKEWNYSKNGVLAIDGKNGSLLWTAACRNQIIGNPIFLDITGDPIPDVFIGGRSAQLMALNGKDGSIIWEYMKTEPNADMKNDTTVLNFFSPQFIPDQDGDGDDDLLVAYGGFVKAKPSDTLRPMGYLMVLSSLSGKVLAKAPMPDGKETYMSPVVYEKDAQKHVLFGTGGETIAGNFYSTSLEDIMDGIITQHTLLAEGASKGFIAPPVLVDLNHDQIPEIIINAYEGATYAYNGATHELLWKVDLGGGYETHSQPAIGQFTGDQTPDFFVNYGKGTWPAIHSALQVVIDGSNGNYSRIDSLGFLQYSSPIALRKDGMEKDDVLFVVNESEETNFTPESGMPEYRYSSNLYKFDFEHSKVTSLIKRPGTNIGSTLLACDLNKDGLLQGIHVYNNDIYKIFEFSGLTIESFSLPDYVGMWTEYMGTEGKSHYPD